MVWADLVTLQQVQVAARQAQAHYRQLALSASPAWLAGVDAAAVRQLLDRLFLACLALLLAAWQAAAALVSAEPAKHSAADRQRLQGVLAGQPDIRRHLCMLAEALGYVDDPRCQQQAAAGGTAGAAATAGSA